jgi:tetratricopeptide (TPR) repeat protein
VSGKFFKTAGAALLLSLLLSGPAPAQTDAPAVEPDLSAPGMVGTTPGSTPIALVEEAYLAHHKGDYPAAIEGYTKIIQRRGLTRKERAVSYLLRGEAKMDSGNLNEARLDFTRALRQWPGYPAAHYFRGRAYEKEGQLTEAYTDIARAVQLDPLKEAYGTNLSVLKRRLQEAGLPIPEPDRDPEAPPEPALPEP